MKNSKHLIPFTLIALVLALGSCKPEKKAEKPAVSEEAVEASEAAPPDAHTSRNALDWNGVYQGVIPCADCEGIKTRLTLMKSGEFSRTTTYLGKEETGRTESGTFQWNDAGSVVTLDLGDGQTQRYQVGENQLFHLDLEGNRITGDLAENYILVKNKADYQLENKKWILTELMGQEFTPGDGVKQAYLEFNSELGRVAGNNTCNQVSGSYELMEGNRIRIGPVASTMMACPNMENEARFNEVLERVDNYTIADGVLSLNKARMAPLARFSLQEE